MRANLPWWSAERAWGFRVSRADLVIVLGGLFLTLITMQSVPELAVLIPFVLGNFFLFCNVFRVRRRLELAWAATFVVNVGASTLTGVFSWWIVLPVQSAITLIVILRTLHADDYHGIACQRINPLGYRRGDQDGVSMRLVGSPLSRDPIPSE